MELLLPPDIDGPVEAIVIKLPSHFFVHKGVELGYLLSGQLEMTIDNESYQASPGNTVYLQKNTPGKWRNTSEDTAELLWFKLRR